MQAALVTVRGTCSGSDNNNGGFPVFSSGVLSVDGARFGQYGAEHRSRHGDLGNLEVALVANLGEPNVTLVIVVS